MKVLFRDGYIETNAKGNTYVGNVAHEFMHLAEKTAREKQYDFQSTLNIYLQEFKKMIKSGEIK